MEVEDADPGKLCWFCADPLSGSRSREHVFPLWLQEELDLSKVAISPTWHAQPLGELLDQRHHTWSSLVAGRICESCNNEWMNDLETEAIPILRPLIRGERTVRSLSVDESRVVSVWATKTFLALSAAVQEKRAPREQYRALHGDPTAVPEGMHIFAAQRAVSDPAHYTIDATWKMSRDFPDAKAANDVEYHSYKACLQFGQLLLLIVWWPLGAEWVLSCEEDAYQVLYPIHSELLWHPPPDELPESVAKAIGEEDLRALDHLSGLVCLYFTLSVRVFHRDDLPDYVREAFGIRKSGS